jgi:hypothetical protein
VFLVMLWRTFRTLSRAALLTGTYERRELAAWADGMRTGLVGFVVAGAFISAQYEKMFWTIFCLSIVVERLASRLKPAADAERALAPVPILPGSMIEPSR